MKNVLSSCLAALSIAVVTTTQAADGARRPNVLFIAVDDLKFRSRPKRGRNQKS